MSNFIFSLTATLSASRSMLNSYPYEYLSIWRGVTAYLPFDLTDRCYSKAAKTYSEVIVKLRQSDAYSSEYRAEIYDGNLLTKAETGMPYFEYVCNSNSGTVEAGVNLLTLVLPADFTLTRLESSNLAGPLYLEVEIKLKDVGTGEVTHNIIEPQFIIMVKNSPVTEV